MKNDYILTIAIPTYNGGRTIGNMLDILLPQITDEVEVIISDNCSTDDTAEIIDKYKKQYNFIKYIRNKENIGADGNFLQCVNLAKGKFVALISDDDILVEGAVNNVLKFLKKNPNISLAYMESVAFKDKYVSIDKCYGYKYLLPVEKSFVTHDKRLFLSYCVRLFGFTSSYIWSTERIRKIDNLEKYKNTYFLQAYISILISNRTQDILGLISGPCIAIGEYGIIGNYDVAYVEGISYYKMIEFAIENGYPKDILKKFYIWKIIFLTRNAIIKERSVGVKKTLFSNIIKATYKYPKAWFCLYPYLLLPPFMCRIVLLVVRKIQKRKFVSYVNRPT